MIKEYFTGEYKDLSEYYIPPDAVFQRVRVDEFVGRDWLTAKVDAFLNDPQRKSGAFLLIGEAGVGKTAFMAHLVKERNYLHLFAEQAPGQAMLQRAMQSLASQLIARYQIDPYKDRDTLNALSVFPDYLERILRIAARTLAEGEKIIIVCDQLDEAGVFPDHFVLGLPKELPDGVYFILSQRPVNVKLPNFDFVLENLETQIEYNLQDMSTYLNAVVKRPEIAQLIRAKDYSEEFFIQTLKEKSQGAWIYLHYIIKEIESGKRPSFDLQPTGLVGYYAEYWSSWRTGKRGKGEKAWNELYAPLLATLAAAQEAIAIDILIEWAGIKVSKREVEQLLREHWKAFIAAKTNETREIVYAPFHLSFRDFISGKVDLDKLPPSFAHFILDLTESTTKAHNRIVNKFEKECNGEWGKLVEQDYPRLHLSAHMSGAGEYDKLRFLLTEGETNIAWAEARYKIEKNYAGFINDLSLIPSLSDLDFNDNKLNSELIAAYKEGPTALREYLRIKSQKAIILNETKLIIIGEGEVGKTCLVDALLGKPFQSHNSTHGIEIQTLQVSRPDTDKELVINIWDFGGQRVYRPTHQLFFSTSSVYLVVWKPREGSQAGQVKEWIQLIKRRAVKYKENNPNEPGIKILVVATHGGPQQRQPDIDRQELWDLFGKEIVVDFFFVDSKPDENGNRKGVEELKQAIARVAVQLPEVGRSVPKSFEDVRQALQDKGVPYLPLHEVLAICHTHKMDDEMAKLFITISHRLGHLTHYENDPTLRDIVILRPDWLATAMSYVLDDEETRSKHGLVNFSRLSHLWNDPARPVEDRYPDELRPIFLRLMERFDLSYRVKDPYAKDESDPISLIGQLVPDVRPSNLPEAWGESPSAGDIQQTQICRIVDTGNGQSANAEGLFYQLIVRLHKYSLGRADYKASVHWQRGLVLEDEFKNRALLEHVGNDVRITVRSPFPEGLLGMLTREVKYLVESFWEGLRCDIMVPCLSPCGKTPGTGMFEVEKLMVFKKQGMTMFPCMVSGCNQAQNIDLLLRNAPAASQAISIAELQSEFTAIKDKLDENNVLTRRVLSQVDKTYTDLLQVLTDEAIVGPRLFSFFPVDRSNFNPKEWIRAKFRLVLWCEHSRLPLPALNGAESNKGVYDLELDREWFKKSAPYLKFLTGTLGMVLPVASSSVKLALDEAAYKLIEEQLDFGKSVIDAAIGTSGNVNDFISKADVTNLEHGVASRADGSTLRELHALLKSKDPGFGGLVRVMNKRQEFLWVHEKFAGEY